MTGYLYLDDDRAPLQLELHVIRREADEEEANEVESGEEDAGDENRNEEENAGAGNVDEAGDPDPGRAVVGFQFLGMRESKRRRIMKALFREYRRQRRAGRESS
jgi:c-di-GMP-binding flagellar brake protein YcgR